MLFMMSHQNITAEHIQCDELGLALNTGARITNELNQQSVNLRCLVLLCNTHDSYVTRLKARDTEMYWQQAIPANEDDTPPPYSLFSSPDVKVDEKECLSDSDDWSDEANDLATPRVEICSCGWPLADNGHEVRECNTRPQDLEMFEVDKAMIEKQHGKVHQCMEWFRKLQLR
jgi:hypothetical protein